MFGFGKKKSNKTSSATDTRDLVANTLTTMNVPYHVDYDVDGNPFELQYQGGNFIISALKDSKFIDIYYLGFYSVPKYDVDDLSRFYRTVNHLNANSDVALFYGEHEEDEEVYISSYKNILFVPEITNIEAYLASQLQLFFRVHRTFLTEMDRQRVKEEK